MKANEFFKKHGLAEVKILLTSPSHGFFFKEDFYKHYGFDIYDDLKRLVESHELVESLGGINTMRIMQKQMVLNSLKGGMNISFDGEFVGTFSYDQLKQAITDVESCQ